MYDELLKALRETDFSYGCPCGAEPLCKDKDCVIIQAADAIEELMRQCEQLPSADAVPVVPCGECEHFKPDRETPASISWYGRCQKNNRQWKMAVADYCSNGWRKDDE